MLHALIAGEKETFPANFPSFYPFLFLKKGVFTTRARANRAVSSCAPAGGSN